MGQQQRTPEPRSLPDPLTLSGLLRSFKAQQILRTQRLLTRNPHTLQRLARSGKKVWRKGKGCSPFPGGGEKGTFRFPQATPCFRPGEGYSVPPPPGLLGLVPHEQDPGSGACAGGTGGTALGLGRDTSAEWRPEGSASSAGPAGKSSVLLVPGADGVRPWGKPWAGVGQIGTPRRIWRGVCGVARRITL